MKIYFFIFVSIVLFFSSCKKEIGKPEPQSKENKYLPLIVGNWVSYQIEEITIDLLSDVNDTLQYQIKEKVASLIESTNKQNTYRLERYYRSSGQQEWKILNVWTVRQYATRIHRIEENIEYIKIITPADLHTEWNTNTFNSIEEQTCSIEKKEELILNNTSVETIFVSHYNHSSLIDKHFYEEAFSENIGLTKKRVIDVELNIDPDLPWEEKVIKGNIYYQNYIEHNE